MLKRGGGRPPRHDFVLCVHSWGAAETLKAMGDPSKHRRWQENSQLFQCQKYSVQHHSVRHINPLSAGVTPFSSHPKPSSRETGFPGQNVSYKDCTRPARCQEVERVEVSFIMCHHVRFMFVLQIWIGMCLRDNHVPPWACGAPWACPPPPMSVKFCKYTLLYFFFFNWRVLFRPCASVLLRVLTL